MRPHSPIPTPTVADVGNLMHGFNKKIRNILQIRKIRCNFAAANQSIRIKISLTYKKLKTKNDYCTS